MTKSRILKSCLLIFFLSISVSSNVRSQQLLPELIKKIQPSIVTIIANDKDGNLETIGTGFLINLDGDIITNIHVLINAPNARVRTFDGKIFSTINVVAEDKINDIVKISTDIPRNKYGFLELNSPESNVGEQIIVIGSPLGFEQTVSEGIISGIRKIPGFGKTIQISAPISPGSSGSPVVNMNSKVVGIVTFQFVEGQNLNFSIPADKITTMKQTGNVTIEDWTNNILREESNNWQFIIDEAKKQLYDGNFEFAKLMIERAIYKNSGASYAHLLLGYILSSLNQNYEAINSLKKAIHINPDYADAHFNLGNSYSNLERYDEAVGSYKVAIRINPNVADMHLNLGFAYDKLERFDEAVTSFQNTILINPFYAKARFNLGVTYGNLELFDKEIESYKNAILIDPGYAEPHYNLGIAYSNSNRIDDAIYSFNNAININPKDTNTHYNLGVLYAIKENKEAANKVYIILKDLDKKTADVLKELIKKIEKNVLSNPVEIIQFE